MLEQLDASKFPDLAEKIKNTIDEEDARIVSDYAEIVVMGFKYNLIYKRKMQAGEVGVHRKNRDGAMVSGPESSQLWDKVGQVGQKHMEWQQHMQMVTCRLQKSDAMKGQKES